MAGPYATRLMATQGAEVIKIELPGHGDPSRHPGPYPDDAPEPGKSGLFLALNCIKKGATLDLRTAAG